MFSGAHGNQTISEIFDIIRFVDGTNHQSLSTVVPFVQNFVQDIKGHIYIRKSVLGCSIGTLENNQLPWFRYFGQIGHSLGVYAILTGFQDGQVPCYSYRLLLPCVL